MHEILVDNSGTGGTWSMSLIDRSTHGVRTPLLSINSSTGKITIARDLEVSGTMTVAGSSLALAAIGSTPNANGATLTAQVLNLQPASASFGGVVTTAAQTFAGLKTFNAGVDLASGQVYKVNGTQVVTSRQVAIADEATANATAAGVTYDQTVAQTAVALVNALKVKLNATLAMLRVHGLIAP
jgi:hypothetical protein